MMLKNDTMDENVLLKYLNENATEEECLQVEDWYQASPENKKTLEQLYYTLFIADRAAAMEQPDVEQLLLELKSRIRRNETRHISASRRWLRHSASIAAFFAGIIITGALVMWFLNDHAPDYVVYTQPGDRAQVILPDGSKVWLNSATRIAYQSSFLGLKRQADLSGEAYFEVAHRNSSSFTVKCNQVETRVLGTKFNVRSRTSEERVVTTLFEGSVEMFPQSAKMPILLTPGQTVEISTHTHQSKLSEYKQPEDVLLWINGRLIFKQATLLEITDLLEKHFDVRFSYENEDLKNEQFTCEFNTDSNISEIISILNLTKRFHYQRNGKEIKVVNQ